MEQEPQSTLEQIAKLFPEDEDMALVILEILLADSTRLT